MSAAIRQSVAAAVIAVVALTVLFAGCTINLEGKTACNGTSDCVPGYACVSHVCTPTGGGGTTGGGNGGGKSGTTGTIDGGPDASLPRMCPINTVTACPADPGTSCAETFCGGRLWQNGVMKSVLVRYQILDPQSMFSPSYLNAIRAAATAWNRATSGFVTFQDCGTLCTGRFISVVPGDSDGITNPDDPHPSLPMPVVGSGGGVSPHRIAHQWGHVLGLSHTYERADRDRYVRFDPGLWCPTAGSGLPPRCAAGPAGMPGLPAVTSGTFGVFDEKSKMNGFQSDGICGAEEPDEDSGEPTIGDISALAELFFGVTTGWSPFRPIGRSPSPTQPLDYQLAPGVDPVGSPAVAEIDYASPEIFVRGTDDRVYTTIRRDPLTSSTADWLDWTPVADDVDADPAVVFALYGNPETLFLATRSRSDGIQLRARRGGTWGASVSLGAPPSGAASAPALASESPLLLDILVRGGDGLIYRLACKDAQLDCAASASDPAWTALPPPLAPPASNIFVGKPSALWWLDNSGLTVAAIRDDRVAVVITRVDTGGITWLPADKLNPDLASDDPGVAITISSTPGDVAFFARNPLGLLVNDTMQLKFFPIGGVLASPPGVASVYHGFVRTDVAAIIVDHGHPGVWWRYSDGNYVAPCNYNSPKTCGECGLP